MLECIEFPNKNITSKIQAMKNTQGEKPDELQGERKKDKEGTRREFKKDIPTKCSVQVLSETRFKTVKKIDSTETAGNLCTDK